MLYEVYARWIDGADKGLERAKAEAWIVPQMSRKSRDEIGSYRGKTVAERAGFEPALGFILNTLSRRAT